MSNQPSRSTRFLTGLATLLLVASVAFGAFLLVGTAFGFGANGHEVGVHTQVSATRLVDLPPGAEPPGPVGVLVRVRHASPAQIRWTDARDLAPGIVVVIAIWLVRGLLVSVRKGDPFTPRNVVRLRALGLTVLVGVPLAMLLSSICASQAAEIAGLPTTGANFSLPGGALLGGLVALVLAEVFAKGLGLRHDLEGTV
jgi:hypothetical protein